MLMINHTTPVTIPSVAKFSSIPFKYRKEKVITVNVRTTGIIASNNGLLKVFRGNITTDTRKGMSQTRNPNRISLRFLFIFFHFILFYCMIPCFSPLSKKEMVLRFFHHREPLLGYQFVFRGFVGVGEVSFSERADDLVTILVGVLSQSTYRRSAFTVGTFIYGG